MKTKFYNFINEYLNIEDYKKLKYIINPSEIHKSFLE